MPCRRQRGEGRGPPASGEFSGQPLLAKWLALQENTPELGNL
jgi:hypothetical protein